MIVKKCDLCGKIKDCSVRELEGKQYDICTHCWKPLEQKLKGKGRRPRRDDRETVYLPQPPRIEKKEETPPRPGEPPKIWCRSDKVQ